MSMMHETLSGRYLHHTTYNLKCCLFITISDPDHDIEMNFFPILGTLSATSSGRRLAGKVCPFLRLVIYEYEQPRSTTYSSLRQSDAISLLVSSRVRRVKSSHSDTVCVSLRGMASPAKLLGVLFYLVCISLSAAISNVATRYSRFVSMTSRLVVDKTCEKTGTPDLM